MISLYFCILQNASVLEPYFDLYVTLTFSAYIAIKCIYFVFFFSCLLEWKLSTIFEKTPNFCKWLYTFHRTIIASDLKLTSLVSFVCCGNQCVNLCNVHTSPPFPLILYYYYYYHFPQISGHIKIAMDNEYKLKNNPFRGSYSLKFGLMDDTHTGHIYIM